jgi:hypothetical protein
MNKAYKMVIDRQDLSTSMWNGNNDDYSRGISHSKDIRYEISLYEYVYNKENLLEVDAKREEALSLVHKAKELGLSVETKEFNTDAYTQNQCELVFVGTLEFQNQDWISCKSANLHFVINNGIKGKYPMLWSDKQLLPSLEIDRSNKFQQKGWQIGFGQQIPNEDQYDSWYEFVKDFFPETNWDERYM